MAEKTVERICENCEKAFSVIPSRMKHGRGRHCSKACQYAAIAARPGLVVTLQCVGCGQAFRRWPSHAKSRKGAGKYCTRDCRDQHWVGENTPNWQNGDGVYKRGPRWHSIRRRILARDGNACTRCGVSGSLHVHHKIPFRMFDDPDDANGDDNLTTLCPPCHRREDAASKWVRLPESGGALCFASGGVAWQLAREKEMV